MSSQGHTEVHLLGFGEPENADGDETVAYLERIFRANARLDDDVSPAAIEARSRELATRRAPGLLADYARIGGSPLLGQCRRQAERLAAELAGRGHSVAVRTAMQFTEPFVDDIAAEALEAGATRVVGLPLYPLCGASTTVAALDALHAAFDAAAASQDPRGSMPTLTDVTGWHRHPGFTDAFAVAAREAMGAAGASLDEPGTLLYFSAHGTPTKYLREGSRYDEYVVEACAAVAGRLGADEYAIGFQNHANRGVEWTSPSNEDLVPTLTASRLVVVPISFIHEQSETLVELDEDFRELAELHGMKVVRVPVPHDAPSLIEALADVVEPFLMPGDAAGDARKDAAETGPEAGPAGPLRRCRCRPGPAVWCLNGDPA